MAGPRSPSPVIRNPNLRASETTSIRRSFTGNPFARPSVLTNPRSCVPNTPANSPAEFGRKLPVGKEGSSRGFEEKENDDKGLNSKEMKCKSASKGSKHFMSPTISAASKFTPSPRKKILGDRNESMRTSITFSDGGKELSVEDLDTKSETGLNQNSVEGSTNPKASKRVTFSDEVLPISPFDCDDQEPSPFHKFYSSPMTPIIASSDAFSNSHDSVVVDSSLDCKPFSSPAIAPLDADPSSPPYDPKTNYLSPRPQFLHYRPNRRIEVLQNKGLDFEEGKELGLVESDSSPDTDATEETQSGDSQKESEDGSSTGTLTFEEEEALLLSEPTPIDTPISTEAKKEYVDRSFEEKELLPLSEPTHAGTPTVALTSEEEEAILHSEPIPIGTPISSHMVKQVFEAKRAAPKPGFFTRSKCMSLLLVLLIACVSVCVTDSSFTGSSLIKDSSIYKLYESSEVAAIAREKIDGLAINFQYWYESSELAVYARNIFDGALQWYESSELDMYVRKYVDGFAGNFKQWASQTIAYLSKLVATHVGEVDKSVSIQFGNLTDLQEQSSKDGLFEVNHQNKMAEIYNENKLEPVAKGETEQEHVEEKLLSDNVFDNHSEELSEVQDSSEVDEEELHSNNVFNVHDEEESEVQDGSEIDEVQQMIQAEMNYSESSEEVLDLKQADTEAQSNIESEDLSVLDSQTYEAKPEVEGHEVITPMESVYETKSDSETKPEVVSPMEFHIDNDASSEETIYDADAADGNSKFSVEDTTISEVMDSHPSSHTVLGISSLVLAVAAASVFIYLKQGKNSTAVNGVVHVEPKQTKNLISSPIPSKYMHQNEPFSTISPTNSEMFGESCPSEMSSYQNTSSYSKGSLRGMNKAQSQERKQRVNNKRESLASSSEFSMGSASYGSFTTYERIPVKHASGDEEIATPVRRSSRIRKQVISP